MRIVTWFGSSAQNLNFPFAELNIKMEKSIQMLISDRWIVNCLPEVNCLDFYSISKRRELTFVLFVLIQQISKFISMIDFIVQFNRNHWETFSTIIGLRLILITSLWSEKMQIVSISDHQIYAMEPLKWNHWKGHYSHEKGWWKNRVAIYPSLM